MIPNWLWLHKYTGSDNELVPSGKPLPEPSSIMSNGLTREQWVDCRSCFVELKKHIRQHKRDKRKYTGSKEYHMVNSSFPGQNGRRFADNIFKCIFNNAKSCILFRILLNFVPKGPIDNNPALVKIMDLHRIGDKLLSEPMPNWFTEA